MQLVAHSEDSLAECLNTAAGCRLRTPFQSSLCPFVPAQLIHANVIDTLVLFPFRCCSPFRTLQHCPPPPPAAQLIHANVIDTSVLFPHPRGPPFKSALRVLASRHLLRTIQQGEDCCLDGLLSRQ